MDEINGEGPGRVLVTPGLQALAPNRLMTLGLEDANGYSSLELGWHRDYRERVETVDDALLDLWNVRYIVRPAEPVSVSSYRGVVFSPDTRLLSGGSPGAIGEAEFHLPPDVDSVSAVRFIGSLRDAVDIPQGTAVAEVILRGQEGAEVARAELLAGRHLMDWGWPVVAVRGLFQHEPVEIAGEVLVDAGQDANRRALSFANLAFSGVRQVATLEVRSLLQSGQLAIYGATIEDESGALRPIRSRMRVKYQEVHRDNAVVVQRNTEAYPRAFLVPSGQISPAPGGSLTVLTRAQFHPLEQVVLAAGTPMNLVEAATNQGQSPVRDVRFLKYEHERVELQVSSSEDGFLVLTDSYYPGWRAAVDGVEAPVLRGNVLFRAIPINAGSYLVTLEFAPPSVYLGGLITAIAALLTLLLCVGPVLVHQVQSGPEWSALRRLFLSAMGCHKRPTK
jgi:hypothetical protein